MIASDSTSYPVLAAIQAKGITDPMLIRLAYLLADVLYRHLRDSVFYGHALRERCRIECEPLMLQFEDRMTILDPGETAAHSFLRATFIRDLLARNLLCSLLKSRWESRHDQ